VVKFKVIKGAGKTLGRGPRFRHRDYFAPPEWAAPKRFLAATGMPIREDGVNEGENLTLACRNALLNMIDLLQERGFSREQAYVISSVAVDLRVSNVVDVPNYVVSALVPEAIFERAGATKTRRPARAAATGPRRSRASRAGAGRARRGKAVRR
jgi:formamidase